MRLYGRLVFITIIYCSARFNEAKEQRGRHLFSLFGFKISDKPDSRSKPIVYSPVIIVPLLTQKQNVFIQESSANENYQENGEELQQLTVESNNKVKNTSVKVVNQDLEHSENNEEIQAEETSDSFRLTDNVTDVITSNDMKQNLLENTTTTTNLTETTTENVTESQSTDEDEKPYPTAIYNNEFIKSLTLTTGPPTLDNNFGSILPVNNENWKNFKNNSDKYSQEGGWFGARDLSFSTDNRWRKFSLPLSYFSSEFRPIAGLYHDGFLHRPLPNRYGFIPSRQFYY